MSTTLSTKIRRTLAAMLAALVLALAVPQTTIAYMDLGAGAAYAGEKGNKNGLDGDGDGQGYGSGGGRYHGNNGEHNGQVKHS